jgi:hypothetical protein
MARWSRATKQCPTPKTRFPISISDEVYCAGEFRWNETRIELLEDNEGNILVNAEILF